MRKIRIKAEFFYDDKMMHSGDDGDLDAKKWFFDEILGKEELRVCSNEIGDEIGTMKIIKISP